ncbi:glycosyltransferase family 2 protein [Lihuaxuella thermophila]|uniref:Glycosyltransferase involved in cell wall bisynthesis n=1 Tax=Lihuaxuella thermophila TaxID=1173111 RepID=A0A1H8FRL5_9BACL|nr:glycosyltransferase family A protein [Lihuaxuella thermophila]SEN33897.1 Glycosyltransferase involved in cell wall bisynthesis [Lihuaxuella thermophila]
MSRRGISIIIPCFNAGRFLVDAVDSIRKQPFQCEHECIVIDDGSTEAETLEALLETERAGDTIVIRMEKNQGAQYARNVGIRLAKYDYILPLDADDCLNTDQEILSSGTYADRAIQVLEERPDVAFVHSISCMFGDYNGYTISAYPVTSTQILHKHHAQTSIIYRKEDAIRAGCYHESILKWQDWSFAVSLLNARFKQNKENNIHFFEIPYHLYRIHNNPSRISSKNLSERKLTRLTIEHNLEIFSATFPNMTVDEITNKVISSKPDKLTDLLYIASNNVQTALDMVNQRGYRLTSDIEPNNIP